MPNYSYRCGVGHETDAVRPVSVDTIDCACGRTAVRVSVYRQAQWEPDAKLPYKDFAEASDMLASKQEEYERREGVSTPTPPLWRMAKSYAERLTRQGATSSRDVRSTVGRKR